MDFLSEQFKKAQEVRKKAQRGAKKVKNQKTVDAIRGRLTGEDKKRAEEKAKNDAELKRLEIEIKESSFLSDSFEKLEIKDVENFAKLIGQNPFKKDYINEDDIDLLIGHIFRVGGRDSNSQIAKINTYLTKLEPFLSLNDMAALTKIIEDYPGLPDITNPITEKLVTLRHNRLVNSFDDDERRDSFVEKFNAGFIEKFSKFASSVSRSVSNVSDGLSDIADKITPKSRESIILEFKDELENLLKIENSLSKEENRKKFLELVAKISNQGQENIGIDYFSKFEEYIENIKRPGHIIYVRRFYEELQPILSENDKNILYKNIEALTLNGEYASTITEELQEKVRIDQARESTIADTKNQFTTREDRLLSAFDVIVNNVEKLKGTQPNIYKQNLSLKDDFNNLVKLLGDKNSKINRDLIIDNVKAGLLKVADTLCHDEDVRKDGRVGYVKNFLSDIISIDYFTEAELLTIIEVVNDKLSNAVKDKDNSNMHKKYLDVIIKTLDKKIKGYQVQAQEKFQQYLANNNIKNIEKLIIDKNIKLPDIIENISKMNISENNLTNMLLNVAHIVFEDKKQMGQLDQMLDNKHISPKLKKMITIVKNISIIKPVIEGNVPEVRKLLNNTDNSVEIDPLEYIVGKDVNSSLLGRSIASLNKDFNTDKQQVFQLLANQVTQSGKDKEWKKIDNSIIEIATLQSSNNRNEVSGLLETTMNTLKNIKTVKLELDNKNQEANILADKLNETKIKENSKKIRQNDDYFSLEKTLYQMISYGKSNSVDLDKMEEKDIQYVAKVLLGDENKGKTDLQEMLKARNYILTYDDIYQQEVKYHKDFLTEKETQLEKLQKYEKEADSFLSKDEKEQFKDAKNKIIEIEQDIKNVKETIELLAPGKDLKLANEKTGSSGKIKNIPDRIKQADENNIQSVLKLAISDLERGNKLELDKKISNYNLIESKKDLFDKKDLALYAALSGDINLFLEVTAENSELLNNKNKNGDSLLTCFAKSIKENNLVINNQNESKDFNEVFPNKDYQTTMLKQMLKDAITQMQIQDPKLLQKEVKKIKTILKGEIDVGTLYKEVKLEAKQKNKTANKSLADKIRSKIPFGGFDKDLEKSRNEAQKQQDQEQNKGKSK